MILGEVHLRQVLQAYTAYYNCVRTHLSLDKDAPLRRPVERVRVTSPRGLSSADCIMNIVGCSSRQGQVAASGVGRGR